MGTPPRGLPPQAYRCPPKRVNFRGRELAGPLGALPREWLVAGKRTGKAQLSIGQHDQPRPAIRLFWMAQTWNGPIERLFEEAEGVFQIEAAHVGAPSAIQVWDGLGILGRMPPEPEGLR